MNQRSIWYLAIAETLVWAGMFYSFPALILQWENDLGWSKTEISATFTTALIVSALTAPLAGRLIDLGYGRTLLTGSAFFGGLAVASLSWVESYWTFFGLWLVIGFMMAGCLYEPCFAFVTRTRGMEAKKSITMITLVAGFAGSVSFPTANIVAEWYGWRGSTATFAFLIIAVAVPLFVLGTRSEQPVSDSKPSPKPKNEANLSLRQIISGPVFWLLAMSFTSISVGHGLLINHLLPLLAERSIPSAMAITAASLIGPMQVVGRVVMIFAERHVSMYTVCASTFISMLLGIGALIYAGARQELVFLFVILHGAGYGVTSITRPVVTAGLLGKENFGAISGAIALCFMSGFALSPLLAAKIWEWGGYDLVLKIICITVFVGLLSYLLALWRTRPSTTPV